MTFVEEAPIVKKEPQPKLYDVYKVILITLSFFFVILIFVILSFSL